ncbi:hypothetical protein [Vibrio sp. Evd11]|uniref:hypothetical protein n=1 Tax=Vibrio sp. Evd11 TaxID=1207404 RepID=UPI000EFDB264|nr:hypothetical protein [Vibrio sp. Evd11]
MQHCSLLDQATILGGYIDAALFFNDSSKHLQSKVTLETANKKIQEIESLVNTFLEEHQKEVDLLYGQLNVQQVKNLDLSISNSLALKENQRLKEELGTIRDSTNKAKIKDQVKLDKYHEWKKLDPDKLVAQNNKLSDLLSKQKSKSRVAYEALELRFSDKCNEVKELKDRVSNLSSLTMGEAIEGKCGDLTYYPMIIESSLDFTLEDDVCQLGSLELDWHFEVLSSEGVSIHIGLTEWCTPILPFSTEIQKDWSTDIESYIHGAALQRVAHSHPNNFKMIVESKQVLLDKVPEFTERELDMFRASGATSLFDLVSISFNKFGRVAVDSGFTNEEANTTYDTVKRYGLAYRKLYECL